jgi:hypothetical protein
VISFATTGIEIWPPAAWYAKKSIQFAKTTSAIFNVTQASVTRMQIVGYDCCSKIEKNDRMSHAAPRWMNVLIRIFLYVIAVLTSYLYKNFKTSSPCSLRYISVGAKCAKLGFGWIFASLYYALASSGHIWLKDGANTLIFGYVLATLAINKPNFSSVADLRLTKSQVVQIT